MAIFNRAFLNEAVEWHGKYFLTNKELHDPKFRKTQYDKVCKFIRDVYESEEFKKKFNISIDFFDYSENDDEAEIFDKWISRKNYVIDITCFPNKEERESEEAKSAANFIIKSFSEYKKKNPKSVFGNLKRNEKYGYIMYKL